MARENTIIFGIIMLFIPDGIKFLSDKISGVNYTPLLNYVFTFLNVDFTLKTWHLLILLSGLFLIVYIRRKLKIYRDDPEVKVPKGKSFSFGDSAIVNAQHPFNASISSDFLGARVGTLSIWGYVSDIHNLVHPDYRYKYIIGYATNNGKESNNPSLAKYLNAWAIQRITPTKDDHLGTWRFWCNNVKNELTLLDYKEPLSGGWHLFSVAWSEKDNYIKFIIDEIVVAEKEFAHWPSDFSGSVTIGTWPTRTPDHFFDSKIGPYRFITSSYDKKVISNFFKVKPETNDI